MQVISQCRIFFSTSCKITSWTCILTFVYIRCSVPDVLACCACLHNHFQYGASTLLFLASRLPCTAPSQAVLQTNCFFGSSHRPPVFFSTINCFYASRSLDFKRTRSGFSFLLRSPVFDGVQEPLVLLLFAAVAHPSVIGRVRIVDGVEACTETHNHNVAP